MTLLSLSQVDLYGVEQEDYFSLDAILACIENSRRNEGVGDTGDLRMKKEEEGLTTSDVKKEKEEEVEVGRLVVEEENGDDNE